MCVFHLINLCHKEGTPPFFFFRNRTSNISVEPLQKSPTSKRRYIGVSRKIYERFEGRERGKKDTNPGKYQTVFQPPITVRSLKSSWDILVLVIDLRVIINPELWFLRTGKIFHSLLLLLRFPSVHEYLIHHKIRNDPTLKGGFHY